MRGVRSPLAILFGIIFVDLVGFGIVIPVLPLYAERFGASPVGVGLLLGAYSFMQMICAPLLGRWSDRIGRRPVLLVSVLGSSAGFLLMGLAPTLPLLFLGRIVDGATGGNISTAAAYIADVSSPAERSRRMGLIGAAFGLGFIFGPVIGGVMSRFSLAAPFFFAAALAAVNAAAVWLFLPESLPRGRRLRQEEQVSVISLLREARGSSLSVVMGVYFFTTVAFSLVTAIYPLFASQRFRYSAAQIGYIFAGMGILGAVVQGGLIGWLSRRIGDRPLVAAGTLLLAGGLFLLPFSGGPTVLWLATAGLALGHALVAAPLNAMASRTQAPEAQGRVLGLMQSSASLARMVGPVLGGWLLHYDLARLEIPYGRTPFWAAGAVVLVAFGLALSLIVSGEGT